MSKPGLWAYLCALACGCASTPVEHRLSLLDRALAEAGIPAAVAGFRAEEGLLTPRFVRFRFGREEPPGMFWLLRFAESPNEQYPHEVRSLDAALADVRAQVEDFEVTGKLSVLPRAQTSIRGAHFTFREAGERRAGFLCLWADQSDPGAVVTLVQIVAPETVEEDEIQSIVRALGA